MTNPDDVRPVLQSFEGKSIPIEWAKREKAMKELHIKQWEEEQKNKPKKRNLGSLLSSGAGQPEGPPPTYLEQMRKHVREAFAAEQDQMKRQQEEMKREIEEQKAKMKEMKMTVWDLMTQATSVSVRVCPKKKETLPLY